MNRPNVSRYNTLESAISASYRSTKAQAILIGNDGLYWVCFLSEATRLARQGFEIVDTFAITRKG